MSWDARQRAMLAEMGLRLPLPAARAGSDMGEAAEAVAVVEAPAPVPVPAAPAAPAVVRAPVPVAPGFAGLDGAALREAVLGCRACGLCEQRRHAVYGMGAERRAQWLVVTDPPDEADDGSGELLGGDPPRDAGRLLDRMLLAAGEARRGEAPSAFVTPIVKCRPPRGRAPQPAELQACEAVLARQAELLQPRLVLAMGLQAARRLTGLAEPLGRLRGRVHDWRGLPLVVTFHPAYLLRSPADKAGAWEDLRLARASAST